MKNNLPRIKDCIRYMERDCQYDLIGKLSRTSYVFRDRTNKRPLHIKEMTWTLGELRHAFEFGW